MNRKFSGIAMLLCCMAFLVSCETQESGFQQTEDGLFYKFYDTHPDGAVPVVSDYLKLKMDYYLNDSLVYSSADHNEYPMIQYQEPRFKGDLIAGFGMMHQGDSASFMVRADSTLRYMFGQDALEVAVKPKDRMRFDVRLLQIQSEADFQRELDSLLNSRQQAEEALKALKANSEIELDQYLKANGIKEGAAYNRVFVIPITPGYGYTASEGMVAYIKYEAYLLDGTFIGCSDSLGLDSYMIHMGRGEVLKGLEEGISRMSKGERAKIVVPYALAYGESGTETIPPYTNLVFDVKMVDLISLDDFR